MTAKNPDLTKRGSRAESGGSGGAEETAGTEAGPTETSDQVADERAGGVDGKAEVGSAPAPDVAGEGVRSDGGQDGAAPDGRASVLEEILGIVRVIEQRTAQEKGGSAGPTTEALQKLAKSVEELGAKGAVTRALRKVLGRRNRDYKGAIEAAAKLTGELRTYRRDLQRWDEQDGRIRRRWTSLAIAVGFPAFLLLGVLVEQQFQVIPLHDPSGGWRGHVWDQYGQRIVDCAVEAKGRVDGVDCPLVVRWPQGG